MSKKLQRAQRFGIPVVGRDSTLQNLIQSRPMEEILNMTVIELLRSVSLNDEQQQPSQLLQEYHQEHHQQPADRPLQNTDTRADTHDHCTCDYDTCICPRLKQLTPQERAAMKAKLDIELDFIAMGVADFNPHTPEGVGFLRSGWKPLMFEA